MNNMDDGLKVEHAAGIIARNAISKYMENFAFIIRGSRHASQSAVAAYIDGLAGVMALTIAGKHGSRDEVLNATITKLREAVDRDLMHLGRRTQ